MTLATHLCAFRHIASKRVGLLLGLLVFLTLGFNQLALMFIQ